MADLAELSPSILNVSKRCKGFVYKNFFSGFVEEL